MNNFQFHPKTLIVLFFVVVGINACRSHKKTIVSISTPIEEVVFYTSCYPIESIFVPTCKLEISDDNKFSSLKGSIYIQEDSIFFFSGRLMLEVMRGVVYRDSFVVVNYLKRICYKGKNDYLQKITGYPVNPKSLLMLFTADRCEETYRNQLNFAIAASSNDGILMQGKDRDLLEMSLNSDNHIENIALYNSQQRQTVFSAAYRDYRQYQPYILPTGFDISAHDDKTTVHIKANFQQILLNQPQKINISVPTKYEVVVLQ